MEQNQLLLIVIVICAVTVIINYVIAINAGSSAGANAGTQAVTSVTTQSISNTATSIATSVATNVATSTVNSQMGNYALTSALSNYATPTQVNAAITSYDSAGAVTSSNGYTPLRGGGLMNFGNTILSDGASNTSSPTVGNLTVIFPKAFSRTPISYNIRFESSVSNVSTSVNALTTTSMTIGYSIPANTRVNEPLYWQVIGQA